MWLSPPNFYLISTLDWVHESFLLQKPSLNNLTLNFFLKNVSFLKLLFILRNQLTKLTWRTEYQLSGDGVHCYLHILIKQENLLCKVLLCFIDPIYKKVQLNFLHQLSTLLLLKLTVYSTGHTKNLVQGQSVASLRLYCRNDEIRWLKFWLNIWLL